MKNKTIIKVPKGVRYIGNWKGFNLPQEPHIMDKTITGCGFTEWCLTNEFNVVLCSPRNILLDNKTEQHEGEQPNEEDDKLPDLTIEEEEERTLFEKINQELDEYFIVRGIKPKKILVTYDSFHVLKSVLISRGILGAFQIIIDEFQSIFTDARFKSNTELEFVGQLQDIQRVCYLSATPMMGEYLKKIPEFASLPYYELDWEVLDPGRVMKPDLEVRVVKSIYDPAKKIIEDFKAGKFERVYKNDEQGNPILIEAREVVFYVNSVNNILQIIKKNSLKPEECNILCAKTVKNENSIKNKLGEKWKIGRVPLEGEERKMFTFCTRTVYLGADFYSPCAISIILSDANVDCLAVDISLDLPQILGRQRLWENPWKNWARFYYKPLTDKTKQKIPTPEEFEAKIQEKMVRTEKKLKNFEKAEFKDAAIEDLRDLIKSNNYQKDYVGLNTRAGGTIRPEINTLVLISEQRAFDIQQLDYKDRFTVINALDLDFTGVSGEVNAFFAEYDELKTVYEKLYFLCEADLSEDARRIVENQVDGKIKSYLTIGKDRLKALGYNSTKINKELGNYVVDKEDIEMIIQKEFHEGDRLLKADIKEKLKKIYETLNINKSAKAIDIEEWFEVKRSKMEDKEGLELVKQKF